MAPEDPTRPAPRAARTCVQLVGVDLSDLQLLAVAAAIGLLVVATGAVAPPAALLLALVSFAVGARVTLRASRADRR